MERNNIIEFVDRLVGGDLTSDGVQYSTAITTGAINTDVDGINHTTEVKGRANLMWLEYGLTAEFKSASSATADIIWKWQARNKSGVWVDLHGAVTETNIGTSYVSRTRQGRVEIDTDLKYLPFDTRLIIQCNEINQGMVRVKSSSYIRGAYTQ